MALPVIITDLSTNTASNSPLGSDPVGTPGTVDDFFRHIEKIIRDESLIKSWELRGDAVTYISGATFSTPGDKTAFYLGGRRYHAFGAANIYGSVLSSSYNGVITTVTVNGDSGATLDTSLSIVHLGVEPLSVQVIFPTGSYYPLTGGNLNGPISLSNRNIAGIRVMSYQSEVDHGNSGAAKSISFSGGQNCKVTVNANTTLTMKAPAAAGHYQLRMIQDATGARNVTIANVGGSSWINSTAQPTFNTAANGVTILTGWWDGAAWTVGSQKVGTI